jgi:hypothetical protein
VYRTQENKRKHAYIEKEQGKMTQGENTNK